MLADIVGESEQHVTRDRNAETPQRPRVVFISQSIYLANCAK